jgi:hypothetical protein
MKTWVIRGWSSAPGACGRAVVGGEVISDHHDLLARDCLLHHVQELLIVGAVAGGCRHRELVAVGWAQRAVDPGLLRSPTVVQFVLDPVPVR